jgi:hypothetical protein
VIEGLQDREGGEAALAAFSIRLSLIASVGIPAVFTGTSTPWLQRMGWKTIAARAVGVARRNPSRAVRVGGGGLESACNVHFAAAMSGKAMISENEKRIAQSVIPDRRDRRNR